MTAQVAALADFITQAEDVGTTIVVLIIPISLSVLAVQRWGKKRTVNWLREALTHENGDGGSAQLATVSDSKQTALVVMASLDSLGERMVASEIKLTGHIERHDETAMRIERSIERLENRLNQA
jgi:hypothetical protein